jgi:hypothetical protein
MKFLALPEADAFGIYTLCIFIYTYFDVFVLVFG